MFDKEYFDELRLIAASDDKEAQKTAKTELADYAKQFDIKVKKTLTLENMIEVVQGELSKMESDMKNDSAQAEGLTPMDLILATDVADDKVIDPAASESLVETLRAIEEPIVDEVVEEVKPEPVPVEIVVVQEVKESPVAAIFAEEAEHRAQPDTESMADIGDFRPTLLLMGRDGRGWATLPFWIWDWIQKNPEWKKYPERFPHYYGIDTLKSLIYYIKRDGSVKIRETRNSQFHNLK